MAPPALTNLSVPDLCTAAGGNPWQLDDELQAGNAGAIDHLADAYHATGVCATESEDDFTAAKRRFQAAYRRNNDEHPINESNEVTATAERLQLSKAQLTQIAIDLEKIAAALAEAQRGSGAQIAQTNAALHAIDDQISTAQANGQETGGLHDAAIAAVSSGLKSITGVRSTYISAMHSAETEMRAHTGYTPEAIAGVDGVADEHAADQAAQQYDSHQRAADEATVAKARATGVETDESRAAAARLRDSDAVHNPAADPQSRQLAGERLDDYNKSQLTGPLPRDTVLGGDARTRAQARLEAQKLAESIPPEPGKPPLSPDQATWLLDQAEAQARRQVLDGLVNEFTHAGMTDAGARAAVREIENGATPAQVLKNAASQLGTYGGAAGVGIDKYGKAVHLGGHWGDAPVWSKADAEALSKLGSKLGNAGIGLDVLLTGIDVAHGKPLGEEAAKLGGRTGGGWLGGWAAGAAWGSLVGPEGTLIVGALGSLAGGMGGEKLVTWMLRK